MRIFGFEFDLLEVRQVATLEHIFFWLAVVMGILTVACRGFKKKTS